MPYAELPEYLKAVFAVEPEPVTVAERGEIVSRFGWPAVCGRVWRRILDPCGAAGP